LIEALGFWLSWTNPATVSTTVVASPETGLNPCLAIRGGRVRAGFQTQRLC